MPHRSRIAVLGLVLLLLLSGRTSHVLSQAAPGQQHPNNAIQNSLDAANGGLTGKAQSVSPGVLNSVQAAVASAPAAAAAIAAPAAPSAPSPTLPVRLRTDGCRNIYRGDPDNIRVNQDCTLRRQAEQYIAINPTDSQNLIVGYNDSRYGFNHTGISYSLDRGEHWGDVGVPFWGFITKDGHVFDAASDPALAFDSQGNAYYAAVLFDINSPVSGLLVTKSNAEFKGTNFHSPKVGPTQVFTVNPGVVANDNDPTITHDKEFIAADASTTSPKRDRVYVTWTRFRTSCGATHRGYCESPIYFSESKDGGATWSAGTEISGNKLGLCSFGNFFDPALSAAKCNFDQGSYPVVGKDGTIYVAFNNGNTTTVQNQQLMVRCAPTKDCTVPANWEGPFKVGEDFATQPTTCPQAPGRQCLPPNSFRMNDFPAMAIDPNGGQLYVAWTDFRNGGPCAVSGGLPVEPCANHNNDVFFATSLDHGTTWSDTGQVNTDSRKAAQVFPAVAVDGNSNVYIGYFDRRYGCESLGCMDFTVSFSRDGGDNWDDRRITTSSMPGPETSPTEAGFLGDYNSLAADDDGVVMVWADTRGLYGQNEEDTYFAKLRGPHQHGR